MYSNGCISPEDFDAINHVITEKLKQYDAALTQHMLAFVHDKKSPLYKGQCLYWQHCMAAAKDILSYSRTLIRASDERATVQPPWADYCSRGSDDDSSESEQGYFERRDNDSFGT